MLVIVMMTVDRTQNSVGLLDAATVRFPTSVPFGVKRMVTAVAFLERSAGGGDNSERACLSDVRRAILEKHRFLIGMR